MRIRKIIFWPTYFAASMAVSARDLALRPLNWPSRANRNLAIAVVAIAFVFWFMGWTPAAILQILALSLVILVPITLMGWKEGKPSKWAFIGGVVYTASYFISNSWDAADWFLPPLPIEFAEPWLILPEPYAATLKEHIEGRPTSAHGFALRIDQANKRLLVAIYCFTTFMALSKQDLQARLIWLVLALAETFSFLENVNCRLWQDPYGSKDLHLATEWGITVSKYACGRVYPPWAPYLIPIITAGFMIWANSRRRV